MLYSITVRCLVLIKIVWIFENVNGVHEDDCCRLKTQGEIGFENGAECLLQVRKSALDSISLPLPVSVSHGIAADAHEAHSPTPKLRAWRPLEAANMSRVGDLLAPLAILTMPEEAALASLHEQLKLHQRRFRSALGVFWVTDYWEPLLILGCLILVVCFAASQEILMDESKEERLMFDWLHDQEKGNHEFVEVLDYMSIDPHGGLQKLENMVYDPDMGYSWEYRIVTCAGRVIGAIFNVVFLVVVNTRIMYGACAYFEPGHGTGPLPTDMQRYMSYTSGMALVGVRHAALVAVAELGGTVVLVTMAFYRAMIFFLKRRSQTNRFDAFASVFQSAHAVFMLSTFSALKLFGVVYPFVLMQDFAEQRAKPFFGHGRIGMSFQIFYFVVSRLMCFVVGLCAFGVKIAFVCVYLFQPVENLHPWLSLTWRWSHLLNLLVQTMGALVLEDLLFSRILNFIAGGTNFMVNEKAIVMREVYMARVAQVIYEEYWTKHRRLEFFVLLTTFNDMDLQHLLLDEDAIEKEKRLDDYHSVLTQAKTSRNLC